jgi:hypothetical protein
VALQIAATDLHIDHLVFQSVVLSATSLQDAIRDTLPTGRDTPPTGGADNGTTVTAIQLPQVSALPPSFDRSALKALESFLQDTSSVKVETFGADMLIADANSPHLSDGHVGIETWRMPDGSTLSILGILPHHAEGVAA